MRLLFVLPIYFLCNCCAAQLINPDVEDFIKESVIKNIAFSKIYGAKNHLKKNAHINDGYYYSLSDFPGFGYLPSEIECSVSPVESIAYPDLSWTLYRVSFMESLHNDTLIIWDSGERHILMKKNILVATRGSEEIKFISGSGINNPIAEDFNLRSDFPESYLPFLKLKLFHRQYDTIMFERYDGDELVFATKREENNGIYEYSLPLDNAETFSSVKYIGDKKTSQGSSKKIVSTFKGFEDKKRFILNQLMKNIYMYKVHNVAGLEERLSIDTANWLMGDNSLLLDSLLPSRKQNLGYTDMVTFDIKYAENNCPNVWGKHQRLISDGRLIVGNTPGEGVEFYRVYKSNKIVLCNEFKKSSTASPCIYDFFYSPLEKAAYEKRGKENDVPPPPLSGQFRKMPYGGIPKCSPYKVPLTEKWERNVDYYLVALDVDRRAVYFISGKDIYLNKGSHLYGNNKEADSYNTSDWNIQSQLEYIKDRLYRYQVSNISDKNIIEKTENSMTLKLEGEEYGEKINLSVTLNYDNPEELNIKFL